MDIIKKNNELLSQLPGFIKDYQLSKTVSGFSPKTFYNYFSEYMRFFTWCIEQQKFEGFQSIKTVSLAGLEKLPIKAIEEYLISYPNASPATTNRRISALKSLFNYLAEESEDESGETYINRNPMRKINLRKTPETLQSRAAKLNRKIYTGTLTAEFLEFLSEVYINTLPSGSHKLNYVKHKERNLAIVALLLASGIRVSECANLELKDLNLITHTLSIVRKGGKKDSVYFAPFALPYLERYLAVRESRYGISKDNDTSHLFVTKVKGKPKGITVSSIQKMVDTYSTAFGRPVSPHMFRHTLASRLYEETSSQLAVATQLGHSDTRTSALYTHVADDETRNALNSL